MRTKALYAFGAAATASGAVAFGLTGLVGEHLAITVVAPSLAYALLLSIGVLGLVWHLTHRRLKVLPYRRGQVPREWSESVGGSALFGSAMGIGLATHVSTALVHTLYVLVFLFGTTTSGAVAGASYGLVRTFVVVTLIPAARAGPDGLIRSHWHLKMAAFNTINVAAIIAVVATAMWMLP